MQDARVWRGEPELKHIRSLSHKIAANGANKTGHTLQRTLTKHMPDPIKKSAISLCSPEQENTPQSLKIRRVASRMRKMLVHQHRKTSRLLHATAKYLFYCSEKVRKLILGWVTHSAAQSLSQCPDGGFAASLRAPQTQNDWLARPTEYQMDLGNLCPAHRQLPETPRAAAG